MSDDYEKAYPSTVDVNVKNWPDKWAKPPAIKQTSFKTYILDPAAGPGGPNVKSVQICEYEQRRTRLVIQVIEQPVALTLESPVTSPDANAAASTVQGRYLPAAAAYEYCFYGPDAMWLNSLTGATAGRVTVTKEYS